MNREKATLIYDGACGFCRRWIERVRRWDRGARLETIPYQTADLEARFPGLSRGDCSQGIHLVEASGKVHRGAAAGREVLRRLPGGWLWALPLRFPAGLALGERLYVWVTHRWGPLGNGQARPAPRSNRIDI